MEDRIAFVVDTNFIFQHPDLDKVLSELDEQYVPYVTQVSVEERIAQQCRDIKNKFDRIESVKREYQGIASLELTTTYEAKALSIRNRLQAKYNRAFPDRIIPLLRDEATYKSVLDRAFMRIPPFLAMETPEEKKGGKGPSDKGFKDSLLWFSLLQYFKSNGPDRVVLLSDDKGFRNQSKELTAEFLEETGKHIEIKELAYFKTLSSGNVAPPEPKEQEILEPMPNVQQIRLRIDEVAHLICGFYGVGEWGEDVWCKYFTVESTFDASDMEKILLDLEALLRKRMFDGWLSPIDVFAPVPHIVNVHYNIPITALEEVSKLYNEMRTKWPQFMSQFYSAMASILNENYVVPFMVNEQCELPY